MMIPRHCAAAPRAGNRKRAVSPVESARRRCETCVVVFVLAVSDQVVLLLDLGTARPRRGQRITSGLCHQLKARGAGVVGLVAVIVK